MKIAYNTYKKSGVNMAAANKLVNYISKISRKTYKKNTETKSFKNIGSFGSIFDLSQLKMNNPLIVSSADGVGTKVEIANEFEKALLRYFSLEKFISIAPSTFTLFIVNTFSSLKLFVNVINRNMVTVKEIKINSFKNDIKYFNIK